MARQSKRIARVAAACLAFCCGAARADGLLHIAHCRIVDDRGPIKAMGVNYVNGFWAFAKDGKREAYLPYLDALAEAKIPFIRMAFGPWAAYRSDKPPAPQIADFVEHQDRYFERLDTFLADLKARHIGVVLDMFWNIDPYTLYFGEPVSALSDPNSRTSAFVRGVMAALARKHGGDPNIWMIEFLNEGNLGIDFPRARRSRADLVSVLEQLAKFLRSTGDRHLIDSGNSLPRPSAQHLSLHQGWKPDTREEFLRALDAETPADVNVASIHVYPEKEATRPWDNDDVLNALPIIVAHSLKTCQPVIVGEFGSRNPAFEDSQIRHFLQSGVQVAAVWGFGRPKSDPFNFGVEARGVALLALIAKQSDQ